VAIERSRHTARMIAHSEQYAINIPPRGMAAALDRHADERRLRGERRVPCDRQHVRVATVEGRDERDWAALQHASGERGRAGLDALGKFIHHTTSIEVAFGAAREQTRCGGYDPTRRIVRDLC
jgi:hypothetical protein